MRPALDVGPAELGAVPIMEKEGRGQPNEAPRLKAPLRPDHLAPSLMIAFLITSSGGAPRVPGCGTAPVHGLFLGEFESDSVDVSGEGEGWLVVVADGKAMVVADQQLRRQARRRT